MKLVAASIGGFIYALSDSGSTWIERTYAAGARK
jgi:hypothetical protein